MTEPIPAYRRPVQNSELARRNLPLLLLQARERLIARFRPVLKEHGITEQQYRVLRAIEVAGPLEPRQICATCAISSPSLAGVLARMEALDLVARERMPHDARRQLVSLTPASRELFRRMWPRIEDIYEGIDADLGPDFTGQVYDMLDTMLARLAPVEPGVAEPEE